MPSRRPPAPRWATLAEAAIYSKVPRSTLRRWIAQGLLPAKRLGPRRIQVDLNDLDAMRQPIPTAAVGQTADDEHVKSRQSAFEQAGNG
jgi:excisionase family DNA binding protein